jgi:hypothetical protein
MPTRPDALAVRAVVSASAFGANAAIATVRSHMSGLLDGVQSYLKTLAASTDPKFTLWAVEMRQAVADGSILKEIESQPDAAEIVERWRRSSGTA